MTPEETAQQRQLTDNLMSSLHGIARVNTDDYQITIDLGDISKTWGVAKFLTRYLESVYRQRIKILTETMDKYPDIDYSPNRRNASMSHLDPKKHEPENYLMGMPTENQLTSLYKTLTAEEQYRLDSLHPEERYHQLLQIWETLK